MITISNSYLQLVVAPEDGASIVSFAMNDGGKWLPLMRPTPPDAVMTHDVGLMASFNLVPWSNRIVNAAFDFQGKRYQLRANTPQGFAIHGDVRERPWRVTSVSADTVTCSIETRALPDFNFPFPLSAELEYRLSSKSLDTTMTVTNSGDSAMPVGFGFHPYFNRGLGAASQDEAQLQLAVTGAYQPLPGMVAKQLPAIAKHQALDTQRVDVPPEMDFSTLTHIGARNIDHCFGGWDGRAVIAYPSSGLRIAFQCDPVYSHVIVYTPPGKPFFAVEPVTHANDGFNMLSTGIAGSGVRILEPGARLAGAFRLTVLD